MEITSAGEEVAHTAKPHGHTTRTTCLSSHLLVGLEVSPRCQLLEERQMAGEKMDL